MKKVKHAVVYCRGVRKKCRKLEHHSFDLPDFDNLPDNIIDLAKEKLNSEMKSILDNPHLKVWDVELEKEGAFSVRHFDIFNYDTINFTL